MHQQQRSQIDFYTPQQHSQIIQDEDGKLYQVQVSEVTPAQLRQRQSDRRNRQAAQFAYFVFGIGAVFVGLIALMISGSILAAATRPTPPVVNPNCWIGCSGSANQ